MSVGTGRAGPREKGEVMEVVEQKIASVCDAIVRHEQGTRADMRALWVAHNAMVRNQALGLGQSELDDIVADCGRLCLEDVNTVADVRNEREDAATQAAYDAAVAAVREKVAAGDLLGAVMAHGPLIAAVSMTIDPTTGAMVIDCAKSALASVARVKVVRSRDARGTSSGSPKGAPDMRAPKEVVLSLGTLEDRAAYEAAGHLLDSDGQVKNAAATARRALKDAILARPTSG